MTEASLKNFWKEAGYKLEANLSIFYLLLCACSSTPGVAVGG